MFEFVFLKGIPAYFYKILNVGQLEQMEQIH